MVAHGANPANVDEETFRDICILLADGVIGNRQMIETLGSLTGAVYNYMRTPTRQAYTLRDTIGRSYDYLYPQDTTLTASDALLLFMTQAQGFSKDKFRVSK